jgi:hypothetical protein
MLDMKGLAGCLKMQVQFEIFELGQKLYNNHMGAKMIFYFQNVACRFIIILVFISIAAIAALLSNCGRCRYSVL